MPKVSNPFRAIPSRNVKYSLHSLYADAMTCQMFFTFQWDERPLISALTLYPCAYNLIAVYLDHTQFRHYSELREVQVLKKKEAVELETPITVYTSKICPVCRMVKDFLESSDIPYKEIGIDMNPLALVKLIATRGRFTVPQTNIGGTRISGFDPLGILEILNEQAGQQT